MQCSRCPSQALDGMTVLISSHTLRESHNPAKGALVTPRLIFSNSKTLKKHPTCAPEGCFGRACRRTRAHGKTVEVTGDSRRRSSNTHRADGQNRGAFDLRSRSEVSTGVKVWRRRVESKCAVVIRGIVIRGVPHAERTSPAETKSCAGRLSAGKLLRQYLKLI